MTLYNLMLMLKLFPAVLSSCASCSSYSPCRQKRRACAVSSPRARVLTSTEPSWCTGFIRCNPNNSNLYTSPRGSRTSCCTLNAGETDRQQQNSFSSKNARQLVDGELSPSAPVLGLKPPLNNRPTVTLLGLDVQGLLFLYTPPRVCHHTTLRCFFFLWSTRPPNLNSPVIVSSSPHIASPTFAHAGTLTVNVRSKSGSLRSNSPPRRHPGTTEKVTLLNRGAGTVFF